MKIVICGSMVFAKEMLEMKEKLEVNGHKVVIPANTNKYSNGIISVEDKWKKIESDVIRIYFEEIKNNDAVLILNKDKDNIKNYIGGNSLIEMAFAHVLRKKVFLLNPIPQMSYGDEIWAMNPIILNGNLQLIK